MIPKGVFKDGWRIPINPIKNGKFMELNGGFS
jgi:hypothetical protein